VCVKHTRQQAPQSKLNSKDLCCQHICHRN